MNIDTLEQLRTLYPPPSERVIQKLLSALDDHCRCFIRLAPFVIIASGSATHVMNASPRGGPPGFVKIIDEQRLLIPDAPGNNRLDTLENILATKQVCLLFLIPGVEETLRVNGVACISCAEEHLRLFSGQMNVPKLVIEITVTAAYLHCPKTLMRSKLWDESAKVDRSTLPTITEMINGQTGIVSPVKSPEETRAGFVADL